LTELTIGILTEMFCRSWILTNDYNNYGRKALDTNLVVTWHGPTFCHESVITGLRHANYAAPLCVILSRDLLSVRQMDSVTRREGFTTKCEWVRVQGYFCACYKGVWARRRIYPYVITLASRWVWVVSVVALSWGNCARHRVRSKLSGSSTVNIWYDMI
jgi:hypothetical protein